MPIGWIMPAVNIPPSPPLSDQAKLYGRDLAYTGDFTVTAAGDYKTVEGPEALRQAVYRRLLTLPGEYRPYPDYGAGVRGWVKRQRTTSSMAELQKRISDQLLQDPRITEVLEVRIDSTVPAKLMVIVRVLALGNEQKYGPFDFEEVS